MYLFSLNIDTFLLGMKARRLSVEDDMKPIVNFLSDSGLPGDEIIQVSISMGSLVTIVDYKWPTKLISDHN